MDWGLEILSKMNIGELLAIAFLFWVNKIHTDKKFDKIDGKFDKIDGKFDKIEKEIQDLRTSINRMEGAFYSKECCMLKNDQTKKKAE